MSAISQFIQQSTTISITSGIMSLSNKASKEGDIMGMFQLNNDHLRQGDLKATAG